jgi:regulator of sigma E protease
MDFRVYETKKTFTTFMDYSVRKSFLIVRMCWESVFDLVTGRYTFAAVSGPVGISEALGDAAREDMLQQQSFTAISSPITGRDFLTVL